MTALDKKAKYFEVDLSDLFYEDFEYIFDGENEETVKAKYPALFNNTGLFFRIEIESGKVVNWTYPKGLGFRTIKIVDTGVYSLLDENLKVIHSYQGYVPKVLQIEDNGYGDYLEFIVSNDGYVHKWKMTDEKYQEILRNM